MTLRIDEAGLDETLATARGRLLAAREAGGHWTGQLSSSALSTATASFALAKVDRQRHGPAVREGLAWLAANQNADGGWGDTTRSGSNISTTLLGWSALGVAGEGDGDLPAAARRAEEWIARRAGGLDAPRIAQAVNAAYGEDRTFSAPILTMCALAGRLGSPQTAWRHVAALPFELGVLSHRRLRWLRVPVVSYALPALIAIGQVRHHFRPPANPLVRAWRAWARRPTLRRLAAIQPAGGGFLEAAPLTSFVMMSLAAMGKRAHPVVARGAEFLLATRRSDGSWPIDTNLATWVTTLSVAALAAGGALDAWLGEADRRALREWIAGQQHRVEHPYTGGDPGGWAWTDLSGGVPDADDTAGALIALRHLGGECDEGVRAGLRWLLEIQNRDGGVPTFCRGWGRLPFDRSAPDLTAHAVVAWGAWREAAPAGLRRRMDRATDAALKYLASAQAADGSWVPLWFGNEHGAEVENRVYGTARVVDSLSGLAGARGRAEEMARRGAIWLARGASPDGGWGGDGSVSGVEETALAAGALAGAVSSGLLRGADAEGVESALARGAAWLIAHTQRGNRTPAAPIGLYFARLWYYEELYPLVFAVWALARIKGLLSAQDR